MINPETDESIKLASEIVAAFVSNNSVPVAELPGLIHSVRAALTKVASGSTIVDVPQEKKAPAIAVRKSVTQDFIICLDDGKKFKSMRRHLAKLGMTPEEYRAKWGLPLDYPMVAPNYAILRTELAKRCGLGQIRKVA
jgi:predicted transcriptional regulator